MSHTLQGGKHVSWCLHPMSSCSCVQGFNQSTHLTYRKRQVSQCHIIRTGHGICNLIYITPANISNVDCTYILSSSRKQPCQLMLTPNQLLQLCPRVPHLTYRKRRVSQCHIVSTAKFVNYENWPWHWQPYLFYACEYIKCRLHLFIVLILGNNHVSWCLPPISCYSCAQGFHHLTYRKRRVSQCHIISNAKFVNY